LYRWNSFHNCTYLSKQAVEQNCNKGPFLFLEFEAGSFKEFQGVALQIRLQRKHFSIMVRLRSGKETNSIDSIKVYDGCDVDVKQSLASIIDQINSWLKFMKEKMRSEGFTETREIMKTKQRLIAIRDFFNEYPYTGYTRKRAVLCLEKIKKEIESFEKQKKKRQKLEKRMQPEGGEPSDELTVEQCRPVY
jgi:DNA repair ATPase RecN